MSVYVLLAVVGGGVAAGCGIGYMQAAKISRKGKNRVSSAFKELGIDPKDVSGDTYFNVGTDNLYFCDSFFQDGEPKKSIVDMEYAFNIEDDDPEKRNYKDLFVNLFKMATPQARLSLIKKRKRDDYLTKHPIFQETSDTQPSSSF